MQDKKSILYANDASGRTLGAENIDELVGLSVRDIVEEEDFVEVHQARRRALLTGTVQYLEGRHFRKLDGSIFPVDASFIPIEWDGKACLLEEIRDVSERQFASNALKESETTLRSFYNSPDMMMGIIEMLDDDLLHISDNEAAAKLFNSTANAMQLRTARELGTSVENIKITSAHMKQAKEAGIPINYQEELCTEEGVRILSETVAYIGQAGSGRDRYSYVVQDITERNAVEEALQQSEMEASNARQQLLDAIEATNDAFVLFGPDDRLVVCNSVYKSLYPGQEESVVPGLSFEELVRLRVEKIGDSSKPSTAEEREKIVQQRLVQHKNPGEIREHQRVNGCWVSVSERRMSEGGIVAIRSDITDLKRREFQLRGQSIIAEMLNRVAIHANQAESFAEVLKTCLDDICSAIEWPLGHVFATSSDDLSGFNSMGLGTIAPVKNFLNYSHGLAAHEWKATLVSSAWLSAVELLYGRWTSIVKMRP